MHITHTKALSRFIQILDSSFPSGTFIHSFGLEPHIILGFVKNENDLKIFLQNIIIDQYIKYEFVVARKVFQLFADNKINKIIKEDNKYSAMQNYDLAKASKDLGYNYLKHLNKNIKKDSVKEYFRNINNKTSSGNEIFVLSAYTYELDFNIDLFLLLWCKRNIVNISQTALKISKIKPSSIQQILFKMDSFIENELKIENKNIQNFNPIFEEIIYQHKDLEPKMFAT
jgi:urease accessory protein